MSEIWLVLNKAAETGAYGVLEQVDSKDAAYKSATEFARQRRDKVFIARCVACADVSVDVKITPYGE